MRFPPSPYAGPKEPNSRKRRLGCSLRAESDLSQIHPMDINNCVGYHFNGQEIKPGIIAMNRLVFALILLALLARGVGAEEQISLDGIGRTQILLNVIPRD